MTAIEVIIVTINIIVVINIIVNFDGVISTCYTFQRKASVCLEKFVFS